MNLGGKAKFDSARRVGDEPEEDGLDINGPRQPLRKREPRSGQIVETFEDEFREVRMPRLQFLERSMPGEMQWSSEKLPMHEVEA